MELFEIKSIENGQGSYVIKEYDNINAKLDAYLNSRLDELLVISNDNEFNDAKALRKEIKEIKTKIKGDNEWLNQWLLGTYNTQCKTLNKMLDVADKTLKERCESYKGNARDKIITLEVKSYDMAKIEQIKAYCEQVGVRCEVK